MNLKRYFTGPTEEEMGMPARTTVALPLHREAVPYKPGTENAQWEVTSYSSSNKGVYLAAGLWVAALLFAAIYGWLI